MLRRVIKSQDLLFFRLQRILTLLESKSARDICTAFQMARKTGRESVIRSRLPRIILSNLLREGLRVISSCEELPYTAWI